MFGRCQANRKKGGKKQSVLKKIEAVNITLENCGGKKTNLTGSDRKRRLSVRKGIRRRPMVVKETYKNG